MKQDITKEQLTAIRFYMGDPKIVKNGPYRGGSKAYNTINALLHEGTQDEEEKIRDGKPIELFDADHLKSYLELILDIRWAMEIYKDQHYGDQNTSLVTYRIDRISAAERFRKEPRIYGYFSTCKWGFLPEYAHTKSDIVLLEVHRDPDVPYLDFSELFREFYAKPEEAEILLPYGAVISQLEEMEISENEKSYYDRNGNLPKGKWRIHVSSEKKKKADRNIAEAGYRFITEEQHVKRVSKCMECLSAKEKLSAADSAFYCEWKRQLLCYATGEAIYC